MSTKWFCKTSLSIEYVFHDIVFIRRFIRGTSCAKAMNRVKCKRIAKKQIIEIHKDLISKIDKLIM